jgi:hypothetical protein
MDGEGGGDVTERGEARSRLMGVKVDVRMYWSAYFVCLALSPSLLSAMSKAGSALGIIGFILDPNSLLWSGPAKSKLQDSTEPREPPKAFANSKETPVSKDRAILGCTIHQMDDSNPNSTCTV